MTPPLLTYTQPTGVIDPDEEIAHLLAEGHQLMLSRDEELARQLQEEENQKAKQGKWEQQVRRLSID